MHAVARQLDEVLDRLDPEAAGLLEQRVREAVAQAASGAKSKLPQQQGGESWPKGHLESLFGCMADEPFDYPEDPPPQERAAW